jgi:hypothetical protein
MADVAILEYCIYQNKLDKLVGAGIREACWNNRKEKLW